MKWLLGTPFVILVSPIVLGDFMIKRAKQFFARAKKKNGKEEIYEKENNERNFEEKTNSEAS